MVGPPLTPFQPYAQIHVAPNGPGDGRPTGLQIVHDCKAKGKLDGRTILITGCSSGLGVTTAAALYSTGAKLFLTARDMAELEVVINQIVDQGPANMPRPEGIEMHLDSLQSVRKAAELIKSQTQVLHVLICNAGIMAVPYGLTEDGLEKHMGVNHFAHFLLFELLRPLMVEAARTSGALSRVVAVSSAGHWFSGIRFEDMHFKRQPVTYNKWQAYGASKTANIYMCNGIARRYGAQGITALSLHPGAIMTKLGRNLTQVDFESFDTSPDLANAFKSPEQGAATIVWAALSPHFENAANGGRYLADCGESGPTRQGAHAADAGYDPHAYNQVNEDKLWTLSCEAVGCDPGRVIGE